MFLVWAVLVVEFLLWRCLLVGGDFEVDFRDLPVVIGVEGDVWSRVNG